MMELALISFTRPGRALAEYLASELTDLGHKCRFAAFKDVGGLFGGMNGIIFVGATGIAVRAVAPYVKSKYTDPAVVVCDEQGLFAISLLSGHEGGANELTRTVADIIGATPVITTASELKTLIAGVGCRRGVTAERIEAAFCDAEVWPERIARLATIDIKRDEAGLLEFAEKFSIPIEFYSAQELAAVPGDFKASDFVQDTTGVDNVCSRAATLSGGIGRLALDKHVFDGITLSIFEEEK